MPTSTEIANMAIAHLGIGKRIAALDSEKSAEAIACRIFYNIARDATLSGFNWSFARKFKTLELVTDNSSVAVDSSGYPEWKYYYRFPSDCLAIRRILSGNRNDSRDTRVPYLLVQDDSGHLIYTDQQNARIEYTATCEDSSKYPPDFTVAFSYLLASMIAAQVTGGDNFKIGDRAAALYEQKISDAMKCSLNEEQVQTDPESEFIRARGGFDPSGWNGSWRGSNF